MKNPLRTIALVAAAATLTSASNALERVAVNIGGDVLLPLGVFSDAVGIGFGGTVRCEYALMPNSSVTAAVGYFVWRGKDIADIGRRPDFKGIPVLLGGKYYFMPEGERIRLYGMIEVGLFIPSGVSPGSGDRTSQTPIARAEFALAPIVGADVQFGSLTLDASARYFMIASSPIDSNIGFRVGFKFPFGG